MPAPLILQDRVFGRLTALLPIDQSNHAWRWLCRCVCGREIVARGAALLSGNTQSCGCITREFMVAMGKYGTHGHAPRGARTTTYRVWDGMLNRCTNPKASNWDRYGGKGIKVCGRWMRFENFLSDMGERPSGKSLDRIHAAGNYEPSNCRWASWHEQRLNRR